MDHFNYRDGELCAEEVPLASIAADVGTPAYVYSRATISRHYRVFDEALRGIPHLVCYAVKANSSLALLNLLARMGSGFDIVSGGELERVRRAGGDPSRVVFSGVGKSRGEIAAALDAGIRCFNVESAAELERIGEIAAARGVRAPVSLRVNPDVDARTHPYISTGLKQNKFGIPTDDAVALYRRAADHEAIDVVGIDCHIGSQLTEVAPFIEALDRILDLVAMLADEGIALQHLDIGGGLGIRYRDENPPLPDAYARALRERMLSRGMSGLELILEPGRAIVGNAGVLLTRVEYLKSNADHHFAIVDAAMNDLMRPALYGAWQDVVAVAPRQQGEALSWDIVGPVCETGDTLAKQRPLVLAAGDLLAIRSAGAYGFSMSSNYNSRPRPPEIMVDGDRYHVVRPRESLDDLVRGEVLLPTD